MAPGESSNFEITPVPVPPGTDRVLLVGGSFDPPHRAHVDLPVAARRTLWGGDGWLLFVPAARSPHKDEPLATGPDRTAMLRLAVQGVAGAAVWTDEVDRGGVSYTVETARRARTLLRHPRELRLLIGADQAAQFHRWSRPREIIALTEPAVMLRAPFTSPEALTREMAAGMFWSPGELEAWRQRVLPLPIVATSATDARELLRRGAPRTELEAALPGPVIDFILERALYRG